MAKVLPYTIFALGDARVHQLSTTEGDLFTAGEVAVELLQESPTTFIRELKRGKYPRIVSKNVDVITTVVQLEIPVENAVSSNGVTLLTSEVVEQLLHDKRRLEMVHPFKLALLKLASQETSRLIGLGEYESALPVALDAVKQGQLLFKPSPALQLFPLYLLVAQANLGLKRNKKCGEFLAMASWLALREPDLTTSAMQSQLHRLYGQLYTAKSQFDLALEAFARDIYYTSLEYGPNEVRTSLGYYNLGKVFQTMSRLDRARACFKQVTNTWLDALARIVLGFNERKEELSELPIGRGQLTEIVDMLIDISVMNNKSAPNIRSWQPSFTTALALMEIRNKTSAEKHIEDAQKLCPVEDIEGQMLIKMAVTKLKHTGAELKVL